MPELIAAPPATPVEPVTEILHGTPVSDPYRWLEDQNSPRTRTWIEQQTRYARAYLDNIPGREPIRKRIREFLAVETHDSVQKVGNRYFFRKGLPNQEQPCIYMREGAQGEDQLLVDPSEQGRGIHWAVKPLRVSRDGRLLLYEIKEGGERTGTFAVLDVESRRTLPEVLPRGYLRGFAFAPDGQGFYYVHESLDAKRPFYRAAYHHALGAAFSQDREIFFAGENERLRLCLTSDRTRLGFLVYRFLENMRTDFYIRSFDSEGPPEVVVADADYIFGPRLVLGKTLAITDRDAPNFRIVEVRPDSQRQPQWIDVVPEEVDRINGWSVGLDRIFVSYIRQATTQVAIFDFGGKKIGDIPVRRDETARLIGASLESNEVLVEAESLTEPITIFRYSESSNERKLWAKRSVPFASANYDHTQVRYISRDGTAIPIVLMGRRDVLAGGLHPTVVTSYGGHGVSMTPQFSVLVAFLAERGCLFALPSIRGGSEFGAAWHNAAKRRNRQTAYDDFLCAAEWLIKTGRSSPEKLAIFGGSNSGLLVAAALTQRPDLFRAVVCMVPILDMLRYHLFDEAHVWQEEYGTAEDPDDFAVLAGYSPYHRVRQGTAYPATMMVSGDRDKNCNPLHARKMTARLQAGNTSASPIILDYNKFRGHSPVLPLSERIDGLTDRLAFLCDQLQLEGGS
ncbi:MAG: prolyl oligopeptidase family serine peptidase [Candidatus Acidiferrales bacterium]